MRQCGECQACCEVEAVETVKKPMFARCEHQCALGCGIYESRPAECRNFQCLWLQGHFGKHHRPDKCGIMLDISNEPEGRRIVALQTASNKASLDDVVSMVRSLPPHLRDIPIKAVTYGTKLSLNFTVDEKYL